MPRVFKGFKLEPEIIERFENAVAALSGPPTCLDEATTAERALTRYAAELERRHNRGRRFRPDGRLIAKRREQKRRARQRAAA